jgi:subtilisin family serine protease
MPGDARNVFTIGAAALTGRPEPTSAPGPAMSLANLPKPSLFSYDGLDLAVEGPNALYGTSFAASFAAGLAATTLSGNVPTEAVRQAWLMQPGALLHVQEWTRSAPGRR